MQHLSSNAPRTWVNAVFSTLVIALLFVGIVAIACSFLPFWLLQAKVRVLSATGQITFFTVEFYTAMQLRLRVIGVVYLASGVAFFLLRRQVYLLAGRTIGDFLQLKRDINSGVRLLPRSELPFLGGMALLAAFLRIQLLFQPMRYDEAYTFLEYSSHPFYAALSFYSAPNNHLFHTLQVRVVYLLFGNHPWALRLPAFLAGLCLVPATYVASYALNRRGAALLAAGLVASSSSLIEYSTNARGYTILTLVFLLLVPLAAYVIQHKNSAAGFFLAVLAAFGFYTIPTMLYPFGGLLVWIILCTYKRKMRLAEFAAVAGLTVLGTAALYTPVLAVSGPGAVLANRFVAPRPLHGLSHDLLASLVSTWREWNRDWPPVITVVLVAGFLLSLLLHRRSSSFRIPLPLALAAWVVPLLLIQRVVPFERVWLFALPLYLIASAAGLAMASTPAHELLRLRHVNVLVALSVTLFLSLCVHQRNSIYSMNYGRGLDAISVYLKGQLRPGDSVVARNWSEEPLRYYFYTEGVPLSYINAPNPGRIFVIVNDVTADTLPEVLGAANMAAQAARPAQLVMRADSAYLYEILPWE